MIAGTAGTAGTAGARARAALIAHELAHLARRDHWVSWLEVPAAALAWWNPLFWWIRGRIRHFAELACDAWAVRAYPADRRVFAEALIDLQARTLTAPVALQGLGATDAECRDFERRLDMIMQKRVSPRVSRGAAALAVLAAVLTSPGFSRGGGGESGTLAVVESRATSAKWSTKAKDLLAAKDYEGAFAALGEVLALEPDNGWAHGRMGVLLIGTGRYAEAQAHLERQYELGDQRPTALYNLACALALAGDGEGALEHLAAAVRHGFAEAALMEKDADLATIRADARFAAELASVRAAQELRTELAQLEDGTDPLKFLAVHAELAAIATADGMLQSEHGHLALKAGDRAAAAVAFGRQAEAGYEVGNALYNRACARSLSGDTDGAVADLFAAARKGMRHAGMETDPDLDALRELPDFAALQARILATATAQMELKQLVLAGDAAAMPALAQQAADAHRSARERGWASHSLARMQLAAGRHAEAFASFDAAAALGFDVPACAFGQAEVLAAAGKQAKALRYVEFALELGYAYPEALGALLAEHALATPAEGDALVERAALMREKAKAKGAYAKEKAWAAGMEKPAKPAGAKVAQDS
jgi:predicted Zn-dependent protease